MRGAFESWAGSPVVEARSQASGFSPGVAARLRLADGRGLFVKAISDTPNAESPVFHRREARISSMLPAHLPVPRLRWTYDDNHWVVLVFDEIHGHHPAMPWRDDDLQRVLDGLSELAKRLTPSPLTDVPLLSEAVTRRICGWQRLRDEASAEQRAGLDPWSQRYLEPLAELEAFAPAAVSGPTLVHFDVRADNILLGDEQVWFFDWPHACTGAAWFDVVAFAPSVTMQGGPPAEDVFRRYPGSAAADADAVTAGVATVAGFFTRDALQPSVAGLPTLRAFQAAQGSVARDWLAQRTGWSI